jgi:hypothetical protein
MSSVPSSGHQLAIAIVAIATAAIGFGLFGADIQIGVFEWTTGLVSSVQLGRLFGLVATTVFYFLVVISVGRLLPDGEITGRQLTDGPMQWFFLEMVSLGGLYIIDVIDQLAG